MNKKLLIFVIMLIFFLNGCETSEQYISEDEAKSIVLNYYSENIRQIKIISIRQENNEYKVKWENTDDCEEEFIYVDKNNGEIKRDAISIC